MPEVKEWREGRVAYKGQWVTHDGSVWQARKDTGQTPTGRIGGASLAAAGRARDVRARRMEREPAASEETGVSLPVEKYALLDLKHPKRSRIRVSSGHRELRPKEGSGRREPVRDGERLYERG